MATYRVYWLGADEHIRAADYAEWSDDEDALAKARKMLGEYPAIEIWEGKRYVGTLKVEG